MSSAAGQSQPVQLCVVAMQKKTRSKPMKAILSRLNLLQEFAITILNDDQILDHAQEEWPDCDGLISFHSDGFPLEKATAYAARTKALQVNELDHQALMLDRRMVYETLRSHDIPLPLHIFCNRDGWQGSHSSLVVETDDWIEVSG